MSGKLVRIHADLKPFSPQGALESFLSFRQAQGLRNATLALDEAILRPFARDNPDLLSQPRQAALEYLSSSNTEWTRQTRLKVLKVFFRFLQEEGVIEGEPMRGVKGSTPPKIAGLPSLDNVKAFLEKLDARRYAQKRLKAMLMLSLDSGLRRGELCTLRLQDLDLIRLSVTVRAAVSKNRKGREVPFSTATAREIRSFLACRPPEWRTEAVFPSESGEPLKPGELGLQIRRLSARFGIPLHAHALRHLCATEFLRATGNLALTARLLGHSNIRVTSDFYEHLTTEDLKAAHAGVGVMDALMPSGTRTRTLKRGDARR